MTRERTNLMRSAYQMTDDQSQSEGLTSTSTEAEYLNGNPISTIVSASRGIYTRIARQLGCDPSHVSRVARGERRSAVIENALQQELRKTAKNLSHLTAFGNAQKIQQTDPKNRGAKHDCW